jgi:hypothetical protein
MEVGQLILKDGSRWMMMKPLRGPWPKLTRRQMMPDSHGSLRSGKMRAAVTVVELFQTSPFNRQCKSDVEHVTMLSM